MLRSVRFLPQMSLGLVQNLNFGLRGISLSAPNPAVVTNIAIISWFFYIFFFGSMFVVLSLLCASFLSVSLCVMSSLLILCLSLRRLGLIWANFSLIWAKLTRFRYGLCSNGGLCACCGSKMQSLKQIKGSKGGETERDKEVIVELRKKLRRERKKRTEAIEELEREREASAWASEEAMAKIMLLQSEKALVEREARQYREVMEKKQLHDKEVIDYLHQLVVHNICVERGEEQPGASRFVRDGDDEILTLRSGGD